LNKRLIELNLDNYQAYLDLLAKDPSEFNRLVSLVTTNVTSFFRESYQFQILRQELLSDLIAINRGTKKVRCWSAGCSSGEEAYTLAIVMNEALGEGWDLRVLASDVSIVKLQEGMAGEYHRERIAGIPKNLRDKYFTQLKRDPNFYKVKSKLREQINFQKINLVERMDIPESVRFDLILCRNVFIYLSRQAQEKVVQGFDHFLKRGGYLFLGLSESLNFADPRWIPCKRSIYRKK
jgi:chemotaxis protein methyltransferase CheR